MTLPTDFSGLAFWYRGDSVTRNVNNVAALLDQSGTNDPSKNATQANTALQPTYNAVDPLYNNQPTCSLTGSQLLRTGTWIAPIAQPSTRFLVGHMIVTGTRYFMDSLNVGAQYAVGDFGGNLSLTDGAGPITSGVSSLNTPSIIIAIDNGASSSLAINQVTPQVTGNAGTNGAAGLTLGNIASGGAFSINGTFVEAFGYSRILTATEIAKVAGYLQQRYGIAVLGSTQSASLVGPTLADLTLASQQRCDRVNASTITAAEWTSMVNASAQELYGVLTSTYQDYNVKSYAFSLVGGSQANNQLVVGPNSAVPDFFQPRALWLQIAGSPTPYVTIPRLESLAERNIYTFPTIVPVYGAIPSRWNILGSTIEVLPPSVAGSAYVLWYVPTLPKLVLQADSIAQFWLSVNGWDEYIVTDVAAKALIKEESIDTANLLLQQKEQLRQRIIREAMPRDISQPAAIVDMQRVRSPWGSFGGGGMPGPGYGWGGDGGGCW